jgi:hypothetical protein
LLWGEPGRRFRFLSVPILSWRGGSGLFLVLSWSGVQGIFFVLMLSWSGIQGLFFGTDVELGAEFRAFFLVLMLSWARVQVFCWY